MQDLRGLPSVAPVSVEEYGGLSGVNSAIELIEALSDHYATRADWEVDVERTGEVSSSSSRLFSFPLELHPVACGSVSSFIGVALRRCGAVTWLHVFVRWAQLPDVRIASIALRGLAAVMRTLPWSVTMDSIHSELPEMLLALIVTQTTSPELNVELCLRLIDLATVASPLLSSEHVSHLLPVALRVIREHSDFHAISSTVRLLYAIIGHAECTHNPSFMAATYKLVGAVLTATFRPSMSIGWRHASIALAGRAIARSTDVQTAMIELQGTLMELPALAQSMLRAHLHRLPTVQPAGICSSALVNERDLAIAATAAAESAASVAYSLNKSSLPGCVEQASASFPGTSARAHSLKRARESPADVTHGFDMLQEGLKVLRRALVSLNSVSKEIHADSTDALFAQQLCSNLQHHVRDVQQLICTSHWVE